MSESRKKYTTIDEYISDFPKEVQEIMQNLRKIVNELAPEVEEAISYQMPTFKLKKKTVVHFAAFSKHIGVYPMPSGIEAFKEQLSKYESGKGSVRFPLNKPIPYDLFKQIVVYRLKSMTDK
jgi:uncharacterized protein YdhG (YjbR/CyaY superfamily)